ncbi:MAG: hypothetical protein IKM52_00730, partial [Clostridia bacterium]|nr:hypothetical protein [Clostridia bacterium]
FKGLAGYFYLFCAGDQDVTILDFGNESLRKNAETRFSPFLRFSFNILFFYKSPNFFRLARTALPLRLNVTAISFTGTFFS